MNIMKRMIGRASKIVIVGAGNIGLALSRLLIDEGHDVVLIEKDPEKAKYAFNQLDCLVINDVGNRHEVLRKAGTEKADVFISVTDSDELNMVSCGLVFNEFSVPVKIAKVRNIYYSTSRIMQNPYLGINYIVNPEVEAAQAIVRAVSHGAVSDVMVFERGLLQMRNIIIKPGSNFLNKSIRQIRQEFQHDFLVVAIIRDEDFIIPSGDTLIRENDNLYLLATQEVFDRIFEMDGKPKKKIGRIVVIGGGGVGAIVVENLLKGSAETMGPFVRLARFFIKKEKPRLTIIDHDYKRCKYLSQRFSGVTVTNADVSEEGIIDEELHSDYDLIITTTGNQELNIITAVYAKKLGIERAVALVKKKSYCPICEELGIDVAVSLNNAVINAILKIVRGENVRSIHSLSGGKLEVVEIEVKASTRVSGQKIRELKLPGQVLIMLITRDEQSIIPDGNFTIRSGDHVIVLSNKELVKKVEEIFVS